MEFVFMGLTDQPFKVKDDVLTITSFDDIPNDRIMFALELKYHDGLMKLLKPGGIFFNKDFPEATVTITEIQCKDTIRVIGHLNDDVIN